MAGGGGAGHARLRAWLSDILRRGGASGESVSSTSRWQRVRRAAFTLLGGCLVFSLVQVAYVRFLPPLTTLTMVERQVEAVKMGRSSSLQQTWVELEALSPQIIQAVLAGEDARFFQHHGFELDAIFKAWEHNQKGKKIRGASTLSQQTARNLFLWQKRSWVRKGLEAYYTVLLELFLPKERILELYLNIAEWGPMTFGVEAGAQRAFQRSAKKGSREISREQAAALSACLPNPRKYLPEGGSRFLKRRQALILKRMNTVSPTDPARADEDEE